MERVEPNIQLVQTLTCPRTTETYANQSPDPKI